jgi:hypothetical protein
MMARLPISLNFSTESYFSSLSILFYNILIWKNYTYTKLLNK